MRKRTITLFAPLAALAVVGTVGAGPAQAHGDQYDSGYSGEYGGEHSDSQAAEIVTDEEADATLADAGVTTEPVDPATAEEQEDGSTLLTFPEDEDQSDDESTYSESDTEEEFLGGLEYSSEAGTATWEDPTVDSTDGLVSFVVDGERTDLLQVVPADDEADGDEAEGDEYGEASTASYGDEEYEGDEAEESDEAEEGDEGTEYDLALTAEGAESLNEVAGDDAFAEGDVLASTDDGKDC